MSPGANIHVSNVRFIYYFMFSYLGNNFPRNYSSVCLLIFKEKNRIFRLGNLPANCKLIYRVTNFTAPSDVNIPK